MNVFSRLDKDHLFFYAASLHEVLESPELVGMLEELGLPYDRVVQLFDEADIDGDGTVSFEEFMETFKETAHDPSKPKRPVAPVTAVERRNIMRTFGTRDKDHLFFFAASLHEVLESHELTEMLGELGLPYDRVVEVRAP